MTMKHLAATLACIALPTFVQASPLLFEVNVTTQPADGTAAFGIYFYQPPDFVTTDGFGRLRDQFQFYLDETQSPVVGEGRFVIAQQSGGMVAIQQGGTRTTIATAPFVLDGVFVGFTLPLALLTSGDSFYWRFEDYNFGGGGTGLYRRLGQAEPGDVPTVLPDATATAALLPLALAGLWLGRRATRAPR